MLSDEKIVNSIMQFARRCEDATVTGIRYVRGTRGELNVVFGAVMSGPEAQTPAVLVEATEDFTWHHSAPRGVTGDSTGRAITLVIEEATGAGWTGASAAHRTTGPGWALFIIPRCRATPTMCSRDLMNKRRAVNRRRIGAARAILPLCNASR